MRDGLRKRALLAFLALVGASSGIAAATQPEKRADDVRTGVRWPGPGAKDPRVILPVADPVRVEVKDVSLTWALFKLLTGTPRGLPPLPNDPWPASYQVPPEIAELDFLIAIRGSKEPRVSLAASGQSWNDVFIGVLRDSGLGFTLDDDRLIITRAEDVDSVARLHGREYRGKPVSFTLLGSAVDDILPLLGEAAKVDIEVPPGLALQRTAGAPKPGPPAGGPPDLSRGQQMFGMRFTQRPASEVLDLLLAAHGLALSQGPVAESKAGKPVFRVSKASDVKGDAFDLSTLGR